MHETNFAKNVVGAANLYKLIIRNRPLGDGGIQGFVDCEFYMDKLGEIANAFYLLSANTIEFIKELDVRRVFVEPQHINYIYKLKSWNN